MLLRSELVDMIVGSFISMPADKFGHQ